MANELKIIGLGCINGWDMKNPPEAYVQHKKNCGTVKKSVRYNGDPNKPIEYEYRVFNDETVNIGRCYSCYTCRDCGIQYTIDSSD